MQVSEEEHIAEMREHEQFILKAKEKVEQLQYEIEKKNELLKNRYNEIVFLNNKILELKDEILKLKETKKGI